MNSVQTVTLNSALSQNWVWCTVCTPRTQVARTLRAQCPCHGCCCAQSKLVASMSSAQPAQVARSACAGRAHSSQVVGACRNLLLLPCPGQVATSLPGRDLLDDQARSRHHSHVATSLQPTNTTQVATSNGVAKPTSMGQLEPCRDIKSVSRHH